MDGELLADGFLAQFSDSESSMNLKMKLSVVNVDKFCVLLKFLKISETLQKKPIAEFANF